MESGASVEDGVEVTTVGVRVGIAEGWETGDFDGVDITGTGSRVAELIVCAETWNVSVVVAVVVVVA